MVNSGGRGISKMTDFTDPEELIRALKERHLVQSQTIEVENELLDTAGPTHIEYIATGRKTVHITLKLVERSHKIKDDVKDPLADARY